MDIIVAVIAAAFVVLVIYLIGTLRAARVSMEQATRTLQEFRTEMNGLSDESKRLIINLQQVSENVLEKVSATDTLFQSIRQAGESVSQVSGAMKQVSATVSQSLAEVDRAVHTGRQKTEGWLNWAMAGMHLWRQWKDSRNSSNHTD